MSDTLDPGITVTEIAAMELPVDIAAETTTAIVGRALRGPLNTPVKIASYAAFERRFGGDWNRSSLAPSVRQFFEHGGQSLHVVRVANNARGAMLALPAEHGVLVLRAAEPGSTEFIRAAVDYDGIPDEKTDTFNLIVQRMSPKSGLVVDQEIFSRVTCVAGERNNVETALASSSIVRVQMPLPAGRPRPTFEDDAGYAAGYVGHAQRGSDGLALSDYDLIGSGAGNSGIFALNQLEHFDLLYLPPPSRDRDLGPAAILAAEQYCRNRGAMLVIDPPRAWDSVSSAIDGIRNSGYASPNICSYFPRVIEKESSAVRPAGGALAGLLCKLDRLHGPWEDLDQAGLGLSRDLRPALDVDVDSARMLVREGLNVIAGQVAGSADVCGSVTLGGGSQMDRRFSSLTVRRLCLRITNAIEKATRWAVFEPDGPHVIKRLHGQVDGFMSYLSNVGAFANDHFVVQCESQLSASPLDPERGVNILIAFHPAGSNEEIALTLHQTIAGCRVSATAFAPVTAAVA